MSEEKKEKKEKKVKPPKVFKDGKIPFKVAHCCSCGLQTQVTDVKNNPVSGLLGTKLIWINLCDDDLKVRTRVGSVTLCKDCHPIDIDADELLSNLISAPMSGLLSDARELQLWQNARIEVIKTYGD